MTVTALRFPQRVRGQCCPPPIPLAAASAAELTEVFKALADPTRLQMVAILRAASAPVCVCDFTAAFELSQPTISHHMARLKAAGLVEVSRKGIWAYYHLTPNLPTKVKRVLEALG